MVPDIVEYLYPDSMDLSLCDWIWGVNFILYRTELLVSCQGAQNYLRMEP